MPERRAIVLAALLLAACSKGSGASEGAEASGGESAPQAAASDAGSVPCALAGSTSFTVQCPVERSKAAGRDLVIVRHPDGGFRRLIVLEGGKRYAAADGSDEAAIERNGAEVEVTLGDDHYLFPAPATAP